MGSVCTKKSEIPLGLENLKSFKSCSPSKKRNLNMKPSFTTETLEELEIKRYRNPTTRKKQKLSESTLKGFSMKVLQDHTDSPIQTSLISGGHQKIYSKETLGMPNSETNFTKPNSTKLRHEYRIKISVANALID